MKYIIITDFGEIFKSNTIDESVLDAVDSAGYTVIDVEEGIQYADGEWESLDDWESLND